MRWDEEMVIDFAEQCESANYQLTLTGSWIGDREQYPGFWNDVYLWWQIKAAARREVAAVLDMVTNG